MIDPICSSETPEPKSDGADIEAMLERVEGCVLPYAGWMGTRHVSALEPSTRKEVVAAITLSEEDGRVTVFTDGTFEGSLATSLVID